MNLVSLETTKGLNDNLFGDPLTNIPDYYV